ncbi:MAG: extracellular solute-binding protein, partial [Spirochaetia bacterium]|nr:extracellular solute-binding protein [Spirochaetia bacterium]
VVLIYNTILVGPEQVPTHWASLLDPMWKGKIAYADPTLSGSAYTLLCTMISAMGGPDTGGWQFIEQLVKNLDGRILSSSSEAYSLVAQGDFYIGLTQEKSATTAINNGATIAISYPSEGTSSVPDAVAIVKRSSKRDLALQFIEFILGVENQQVMATLYNRRPVRKGLPPPLGLLDMNEIRLTAYDLAWAATNKAAIVKAWSKILDRYNT